MSGAVKSNVFGSSGTVAAAAGGLKWEDVVTASTVTVESNRGYFINTTSNACTVTLPASPDVGDQVILLDYARTWDTNAITIDSNGNDFQNQADDYVVDYDTEGQGINIVFSGSTNGWIPNSDIANALTPAAPPTQRAIFAFGNNASSPVNMSNLVSSSGVVGADVTGVGTARQYAAAVTFGGDKAIFGYGTTGSNVSLTNLVSNEGVVASDVSGVGQARNALAASTYGLDKGIFGYGESSDSPGTRVGTTNLVSNTGVVGSDVSGVGTSRTLLAAAGYGLDKGIFAYGWIGSYLSMSNLINNVGVAAADVSGVGTARRNLAAASYSTDKAIFGYGLKSGGRVGITNLVNSSGVIASDTSGVGTSRQDVAASRYGGDKAIFAYGYTGSVVSMSNLVNNSGVVAADVTGVGTARYGSAAAGYSFSA